MVKKAVICHLQILLVDFREDFCVYLSNKIEIK
jgi:hypothetical protein